MADSRGWREEETRGDTLYMFVLLSSGIAAGGKCLSRGKCMSISTGGSKWVGWDVYE